ncbi:hypothetical protein SAMN05444005_101404 [Flavobacterium urocaniciphilum]|uniref:Uncharacterized protein n=1 Tax=Flavobacterium urocaniciphilum TaxID=1299341 RepID=A0A1H8Z0D2_9FLAO|nr:hypothetical protein SAMN05444005_101404 [Flavobacterium urocaniciphilum]
MSVLVFTFICVFFVFIPGLIHVKLIKYLRTSKYYNRAVISALILIIISILMWEDFEIQKNKHLRFVGFAPLLFLILFKILNNIWNLYLKEIYTFIKNTVTILNQKILPGKNF